MSAITAALMVASGISAIAAPAQAATSPTVVSLTFDDANYDQLAAAEVMNANGLTGTFFVTSGFVGSEDYLTQTDLHTIAGYGNEIGGHTLTHPDLTTLSTDDVKRQVCNDRKMLDSWGFDVTSFAYPFAEANSAVEQIVKECGYNSGRGLGDLRTPPGSGCPDCDYAETMPPANPFWTKAADQVGEDLWTLEDLKQRVTDADSHGGGWVQLTFHHVCNQCSSPDLDISPDIFKAFVEWLKNWTQTTSGVVKTVNEVIGGDVKPVVPGPTIDYPAPPAAGENGVVNPGLETIGSDGLPNCWYKGGYGGSTSTAETMSPGHTGSTAVKLTVSNAVTDSDAKMLSLFTDPNCTPGVTPGDTYSLRAWYKSDVITQFVAYYRDANGLWPLLSYGPALPPTGDYTHAEWTTPTIPDGATGLSFGLAIQDNGSVTTDDYEMYNTVGAPAFQPSGDLTFAQQPAPTITGTAKVGEVLTANLGTWVPEPFLVTYQWAVGGVDVTGATGATYTPVADDAGKTVTVTVTATRAAIGGEPGYKPVTKSSEPTAPVAGLELPFTATPKPTIEGTAQEGSVLTAKAGTWEPAPDTLTYQWSVGDKVVAGATSSTYTPGASDVGQTVTVTVTAAKAGYTTSSQTSDPTAAVIAAVVPPRVFTSQPKPTIEGTAQEGSVLTAKVGTWEPAPDTVTYQWLVGGKAVAGATSSTYTPVAGDVGKTVTVTVTAAKAGYTTASQTSDPTAAVIAAVVPPKEFTATPKPTIAGTAQEGSVLTAKVGTWEPAPDTVSYQWLVGGKAVAGATSSTYTPVAGDVGKTVTVTVTAAKAGYTTASQTSDPTGAVIAAVVSPKTFTAMPMPTISGTAKVGGTLTVKAGAWSPTPDSIAYKWSVGGVAVASATGSTYKPVAADVGKTVTVTVTASKAGYTTASQTSAATAKVVAAVTPVTSARAGGADRYATSVEVSKLAFKPGVPVLYIATGLDYPDALAGSAAAAHFGGPVLLVQKNKIPALVATEIARLKPVKIIVLGGTAAVSETVKGQLAKYAPTTRQAGDDRYATAVAVSRATFGAGVPVVYIATGSDYPDALSGASAAAVKGGPVLLVQKGKVPTVVANELARLKPGKIVVLGGTAVVSSQVASQLGKYALTSRLAGDDRYGTSAAISKATFAPHVPVVYLATGADYPDALSAAAAAGLGHGPVLLVQRSSIPKVIQTELARLQPDRIVVVGGTTVVSNAVLTQAVQLAR